MPLEQFIKQRLETTEAEGWYKNRHGERIEVKCITFHEYMAICLYDDTYGYYRSGQVRVGRDGDFYTSSGIGTIMAELTASYIRKSASEWGECTSVCEWGGGTGQLASQMLSAWLNSDPEWAGKLSYWFIDDHPAHMNKAKDTLSEFNGRIRIHYQSAEDAIKVTWDDEPVIMLANELLDAFPVHRVMLFEGDLWELGVTYDKVKGGFRYCYMALSDPRIEASMRRDRIMLHEGQETEIGLAAELWLSSLMQRVKKGSLILIDYGDTSEELTAPHRMKGSLLCYRNHQAYDDPFLSPGQQDITAHVNFTACRNIAEANGWRIGYYNTQKQFLVDQGIMSLLANHAGRDPFSKEARRNRSIRQLLLSDGMSETFKVLVLTK
ncbi:class I SAM-dependent methyltransferase [Paenibacillus abyssi]|uniref:SAM-dependent methyltransferase n=1 Tax=Paenibacillus abyssi TaxID=1340531 RepID=A0A917D4V0_9BACL|nr:SAM-dependent methyltransferase [Paenibacillus abyssi]GGG10364.1 SAM-dependent methyltransferase [Paenibacillus abyssi]